MIIDGHSVHVRPGFEPKKPWAVFLDRDGVINIEKGFAFKIEDFELIPQIIPALRNLNQADIPVIVVHNAAAVARDLCQPEQVEEFNRRLIHELSLADVHIDALLYCPHHHDAFNKSFVRDCDWRKPRSGMLKTAAEQFRLDLPRSYLIGDHERDVEAARAVGVTAFLIKTGEEMLEAIKKISSERS